LHSVLEYFFYPGATAPSGSGHPHSRGFTIILSRTTLGRSHMDEWSVRRRQHKTPAAVRHPCPRRDSNPQSQQASGYRRTLYTARPLGSAHFRVYCTYI